MQPFTFQALGFKSRLGFAGGKQITLHNDTQQMWSSIWTGLQLGPGEGNGNPLRYSCLENPTDGGAWWATVHRSQRVGHDWATSLSLSAWPSILSIPGPLPLLLLEDQLFLTFTHYPKSFYSTASHTSQLVSLVLSSQNRNQKWILSMLSNQAEKQTYFKCPQWLFCLESKLSICNSSITSSHVFFLFTFWPCHVGS